MLAPRKEGLTKLNDDDDDDDNNNNNNLSQEIAFHVP
jgi:hypothetical protein